MFSIKSDIRIRKLCMEIMKRLFSSQRQGNFFLSAFCNFFSSLGKRLNLIKFAELTFLAASSYLRAHSRWRPRMLSSFHRSFTDCFATSLHGASRGIKLLFAFRRIICEMSSQLRNEFLISFCHLERRCAGKTVAILNWIWNQHAPNWNHLDNDDNYLGL